MLATFTPPEDIPQSTYESWMSVDLGLLQLYELGRQEFSPDAPRGMDLKALGARGVQGRQAKTGQQGSLLSPWLQDPTQRFEQAAELQLPLAGNPAIEADPWYPISAAATLGPDVLHLQKKAERMLRAIGRAVRAADAWAIMQRTGWTQQAHIQSLRPGQGQRHLLFAQAPPHIGIRQCRLRKLTPQPSIMS